MLKVGQIVTTEELDNNKDCLGVILEVIDAKLSDFSIGTKVKCVIMCDDCVVITDDLNQSVMGIVDDLTILNFQWDYLFDNSKYKVINIDEMRGV